MLVRGVDLQPVKSFTEPDKSILVSYRQWLKDLFRLKATDIKTVILSTEEHLTNIHMFRFFTLLCIAVLLNDITVHILEKSRTSIIKKFLITTEEILNIRCLFVYFRKMFVVVVWYFEARVIGIHFSY